MDCYLHHQVIKALVRQQAVIIALLSATVVFAATSAVFAAPESEWHSRLAAAAYDAMLPSFTDQIRQITPGVQVGPVKIGMSAYDAAGVALAFEQATGCQIDLRIVGGRVVAAGTRFGGCLHVSLPRAAHNVATTLVPPSLHWDPVIDGPASDFVAAFGDPVEVDFKANCLALIWPNGLVAQVGGIHKGDGNVTYLAVVAPGTTEVPAIGYLRTSLTSIFEEF